MTEFIFTSFLIGLLVIGGAFLATLATVGTYVFLWDAVNDVFYPRKFKWYEVVVVYVVLVALILGIGVFARQF